VFDAGFDVFGLQLIRIQLLASARAPGNEPGEVLAVFVLRPLLNAEIAGITEYSTLFSVQQFAGWHDVVNVSSGGIDAVNEAQSVIDANVHLQSGKDSVLPHHPPLRTVRESHPSYGSSLSTA